MKCLYIGFIFFVYNHAIWSQDLAFPTDEETSHVSDGNSTIIDDRIPVPIPDHCPKDMLRYLGDSSTEDAWVCDCRPRFLYFTLNNSCYEAYRQGPCPPKNYVILPENAIPRCVENPCLKDGEVSFNGICYPLQTIGDPCAPDGRTYLIGVNETTFQLECVQTSVARSTSLIDFINPRSRICPPGSRRSTLGVCIKVKRNRVRRASG